MTKEDFKAGIRRRFLLIFDEIVKNKGVTDKEIAESIGLMNTYIPQIRAGQKNPQLEILVAICDKYGYNLTYLITGEKEQKGKLPADEISISEIYQEVQEIKMLLTQKSIKTQKR